MNHRDESAARQSGTEDGKIQPSSTTAADSGKSINGNSSYVQQTGNRANLENPESENDEDQDGEDQDEDDEDENNQDDDADENEDDDEEEEDEDEDDMPSRVRRKRQKKDPRNRFLDVEAEIDEDDEEDEDEDDLLYEKGFIQEYPQDLTAEAVGDVDEVRHRELDRRRQQEQEVDAQKLADQYKEKYGRSRASRFRGDTDFVPQETLLPSVNDPKIYAIKCRLGKEKDVVFSIMNRSKNFLAKNKTYGIISAFQRDCIRGFVYVEAENIADIESAIESISNIFPKSASLMPIKEMTDLLKITKVKQLLVPGAYVRIKRGLYKGDLAQVDNIHENGSFARLKIVPRISYTRREDEYSESGVLKRKKNVNLTRPKAQLFNERDAYSADKRSLIKRGPNMFSFGSDEFEDGFLMKDVRIAYLETEKVNPKLEEVSALNQNLKDEKETFSLEALSQSIKPAHSEDSLQVGTTVEIIEGEQSKVFGEIESISSNVAKIRSKHPSFYNQLVEAPLRSLKKKFNVGDFIRVVSGKHLGEVGTVVKVTDNDITFMDATTKTNTTVFIRDADLSKGDTAISSLIPYELFDLVELDMSTFGCIVKVEGRNCVVVDQQGTVRTINSDLIKSKLDDSRIRANDRFNNTIKIGDIVQECSGLGRRGSLSHLYRRYAFIKIMDQRQQGYASSDDKYGIFVTQVNNLKSLSSNKQVASYGRKNDLYKPNPTSSVRDYLCGKTIKIIGGHPRKGQRGIVKETTDTHARVELQVENKIISVAKEFLAVESGDQFIQYKQYVLSQGFSSAPPPTIDQNLPNLPIWARTADAESSPPDFVNSIRQAQSVSRPMPSYNYHDTQASSYYGVSTPAWNNSEAVDRRASAWNENTSRTPAWTGQAAKTPLWGANRAKTPSYGISGASPSNEESYKDGTDHPSEIKAPWDNQD